MWLGLNAQRATLDVWTQTCLATLSKLQATMPDVGVASRPGGADAVTAGAPRAGPSVAGLGQRVDAYA